jgi:hypothetical protein
MYLSGDLSQDPQESDVYILKGTYVGTKPPQGSKAKLKGDAEARTDP